MTSWYDGINRTLVLWYFGKFCQRTTTQCPPILYRPNEVQKLDRPIFGISLFTKMIAYTTSYAATSLV